jgi:ribosome-associated protein
MTEGQVADTLPIAMVAAQAAESKKARDIVLLDMRGLVSYTDHFVICSGQTPRQTKAIVEEVRKRLKEEFGITARRVEGEREGEWVLVDFLDIVLHCFTVEARDFYRLERLWREAPRVNIAPEPVTSSAAPGMTG